MNCHNCVMVAIQGIPCHEAGCLDSWKDYDVSCRECGFEFLPSFKQQKVCKDCVMEVV